MTDQPARPRKTAAAPPQEVPPAAGAGEAVPAPAKRAAGGRATKASAPQVATAPESASAPSGTTQPTAAARPTAAGRSKAPAVASGAEDPPGATSGAASEASPGVAPKRRAGLPLRDPGQARPRPARRKDEPVGDGSIDPGEPDPAALAMARRIVELAEDKKAADILLLDIRALTAVTDYFVICSGQSERQLGAIADGIAEGLKEEGILPLGREGGANAHWVLLDFGAAIVHVMAPPEREFYQLEKLWADGTLLLHVQ